MLQQTRGARGRLSVAAAVVVAVCALLAMAMPVAADQSAVR
jgi:hypothetical protein